MLKNTKTLKILLGIISILVLSLGFYACGKPSQATESTTDQTGEIAGSPLSVLTSVEGDVLILKSGEQDWVQGKIGMKLGVDHKIKTGPNGHAMLTFFEGTTIELKEDTEIELSELTTVDTSNTIKIKQTLGETISRVKKLADPASRYDIETPVAVAAVRGSIMYISVDFTGSTIVGNIEGSINVTAQGIEVNLPNNTHVTVNPGQPPGELESGGTPTTTTQTTSTTQSDSEIAGLTISNSPSSQQAYPGDTMVYTYTVSNTGNVSLSGISVFDDRVGQASYQSGDANSNQIMEINETWVFKISYVIKLEDVGQIANTAVVSGVSPKGKVVTASSLASVNVTNIIVKITSLQNNDIVGNAITVSGTVNDPSIKEATIKVNGFISSLPIINGTFTTTVELAPGVNTITVTVTKSGITASDTVELIPVTASTVIPQ